MAREDQYTPGDTTRIMQAESLEIEKLRIAVTVLGLASVSSLVRQVVEDYVKLQYSVPSFELTKGES